MLKKILSITLFSCLSFLCVTAEAKDNEFYFSTKVGVSLSPSMKDTFYDQLTLPSVTTPVIEVGVGYNATERFRVGVVAHQWFAAKRDRTFTNVSYADRTCTSVYLWNKIAVRALMLNGYYDLFSLRDFNIYGMAGVGFSQVGLRVDGAWTYTGGTGSGNKPSNTKNNIAYNVGAGVTKSIYQNIFLDVGGSYFYAGSSQSYNNGASVVAGREVVEWTLNAGLRFNL